MLSGHPGHEPLMLSAQLFSIFFMITFWWQPFFSNYFINSLKMFIFLLCYPMSVIQSTIMFLSTGQPSPDRKPIFFHVKCKLDSLIYMQMWELQYPKRILYFDEFPLTGNGRKVGRFSCCLYKLGMLKMILTPLTVKPTVLRLRVRFMW